jgi:predicted transcriptional regulator
MAEVKQNQNEGRPCIYMRIKDVMRERLVILAGRWECSPAAAVNRLIADGLKRNGFKVKVKLLAAGYWNKETPCMQMRLRDEFAGPLEQLAERWMCRRSIAANRLVAEGLTRAKL